MTDLVFVDTNVVIYSRDKREPDKARQATAWLRILRTNDCFVVSPQVLNELFAVASWKFRDAGQEAITAWVRSLLPFCRAPLDADVVAAALDVSRRFGFAWWDCVIVASALRGNCRYLLTEDMQHRQTVRTIEIIDPFRVDPDELLQPTQPR
jgi:predicted nucleic acid-binding protein